MGILDWKPRWKVKGTKEPPAFFKDEGRSSLYITGALLELDQEMELMSVEEHEAFLDQLRKILHDYDHDGSGDLIDMCEVAMTAYGFAKHSANSFEKRNKELEEAILTHKRTRPALVRQHEEGRRVSPTSADNRLWEVLDKNRVSATDLVESHLKISELGKAKRVIAALITAIRHMARERPVLDECWYAIDWAEDMVPTMVPTIDEINAASSIPIPPWLSENEITVKWELADGDHRLIFQRKDSMAILSAGGESDEWSISGADLLKLLNLIVTKTEDGSSHV